MTGPRIGVDIGGTFTDVVIIREGTLEVHKVPSTPSSPDEGVMQGLTQATSDATFDLNDVAFVGHGTTVATNAVLEGEWEETALITTRGFGDVLEIGRQTRPDIYDLHAQKPDPIVPRDRRYEISERVDERGEVHQELAESALHDLAEEIEVGSIAIAFLFAYENPVHERKARDILEEKLDASISISSDVLPEIREYERTLVTALNAALKPIIETYIERIDTRIRSRGFEGGLNIMGSSGGVMPAETAKSRPVTTLLSGPAAGVQGATHVANFAGFQDLLTMDMGGTSCDVSLVREGDPLISTDVEVGPYPVSIPMVDIHTVGSGGGSIARIDEGGALKVGPSSAGARPGPICYG
ncbi:MAG: hydantoinase/oxoprolinase family protein, partial [Halobacteriaceae archaeon]